MALRQRQLSIPASPKAENDVVSLIQPSTVPSPQTVLTRALQSSANLANLLPTGTIFAFQLLTPIVTNGGSCETTTLPAALLAALGFSCLLASFTDSLKCSNGDVHYGFVTRRGLWLLDSPDAAVLPDLSKFRLRGMDVVHALLSLVVFAAVALRDKNVVGCFYPMPRNEVQKLLDVAPVAVGFLCSLLFVVFPTKRHGIGYPVTRDS
ncbi:protein DMP3-like [Salvia miltiorrhiza]|uniref:protein DMP3-like n=1 Tax=Salvia miltiorrhiza TaxID=226208 RepID=UPI0025ACA25E|nr:protein DMP3-like [Salvia miltiorrhiza]